MQRGVISSNSNCTGQLQGPASIAVRIPAVPVTRLPPHCSFVYANRNTRRLVAWEDEIALESLCPFIKQLHYWFSSITHYVRHLPSYPISSPASRSSPKSPPALTTAFSAAWLNLRRFSTASLSRRALVLLLPEGATPVKSFSLSDAV